MHMIHTVIAVFMIATAYGAAKKKDECEIALFTITGMAANTSYTPMRGLLFCSTQSSADNPRALIDKIRMVSYGNERPYQWLVDIRQDISASVKIEHIQDNQHVRVSMAASGEKVINPLGTIDPSTVGVVLGGHNPFKLARIPLDYQQWLKCYSDAGMCASSSVLRAPVLPFIVRQLNIRKYSKRNHLAETTYNVDRAQLRVCTRPDQSIETIYTVLNVTSVPGFAIVELLKKSMMLNPAYVGLRVKLKLHGAATGIVFDAYRKSGKIRTACRYKPNGRIIKSTTVGI